MNTPTAIFARPAMFAHTTETPIGSLTLIASCDGLTHVLFDGVDPVDEGIEVEHVDDHPLLNAGVQQLGEYFSGQRREFDLDLAPDGTEFQRTCWFALPTVPYGETRTYGEQAEVIGRPSAVRAVGAANGKNPLPIVLPCHRIIGADGSLTGFAGGLAVKAQLLDLERQTAGLH